MAIEKTPATPVEGLIEQDPEGEALSISIENPESVSIETEDGGLLIDFDPQKEVGNVEFNSNLVDFIDEDELDRLGSELTSAFQMDKDSRKDWEDTYTNGLDQLGL